VPPFRPPLRPTATTIGTASSYCSSQSKESTRGGSNRPPRHHLPRGRPPPPTAMASPSDHLRPLRRFRRAQGELPVTPVPSACSLSPSSRTRDGYLPQPPPLVVAGVAPATFSRRRHHQMVARVELPLSPPSA
jgi:hypothetical protein